MWRSSSLTVPPTRTKWATADENARRSEWKCGSHLNRGCVQRSAVRSIAWLGLLCELASSGRGKSKRNCQIPGHDLFRPSECLPYTSKSVSNTTSGDGIGFRPRNPAGDRVACSLLLWSFPDGLARADPLERSVVRIRSRQRPTLKRRLPSKRRAKLATALCAPSHWQRLR